MVFVKRAVFVVLIIVGLVAGYFLIGSNGSAKASPDEKAPVTISLDRERYSPTDTMVITVTNNGNETVTVGYPFELYREENGEWVKVNVDLMFIQSVVQLEPGKSWTQKVSLSQLKLSPGHYKIEKKVSTPTRTFSVSAEFYIEG
ncbi:immunoglobulin-like domain-containing protein [Thermococcus sp. 21S9]|uniref:immunoglobulin-like domain-containing protein n=1 Tax=Thermococcus sp. 21S9 TaxID=1638223 RepID=UPI00143A786D|nr:immunoglobulin-like domain-containing protein [Thermococcus sp. 21S9]